jgi:hypothetical protein
MKQGIMLLAMLVALTGCATGGVSSGNATKVKLNAPETLSSNKEVYIGDFRVTFLTQDKSSATARSPMMRGAEATDYAKVTLRAKLTGVPQDVMQSITDQAFADFQAELRAKGYTILDPAGLQKLDAWRKLGTTPSPNPPFDVANGETTSQKVMQTLIGADSERNITFSPSGMSLLSTGMNNLLPYNYGLAAEQSGKAIVRAHYKVHFVYFGSETDHRIDYLSDGRKQTLTAEMTLGQGIQILSGSAIEFAVDQGGTFSKGGSVSLVDPVAVGGAYGENLDTTSMATKAANVFSSAVGVLSGGSATSKEISVRANPDFYREGVLKALDVANSRMIGAIP